MESLGRRVTSKIKDYPSTTPTTSIAIKVKRRALRSVVDKGLKKTNWFERKFPISVRTWVNVEAAEHGTDDSVFFVPENPRVDKSHIRTLPAEYIKINPGEDANVVRRGEDFEVSFIGMSVAPMHVVRNNEILLFSLTREHSTTSDKETKPEQSPASELEKSSQDAEELEKLKRRAIYAQTRVVDMATTSATFTSSVTAAGKSAGNAVPKVANVYVDPVTGRQMEVALETDPVLLKGQPAELKKIREMETLSELPTALTVQHQDIPFLHYDPEVDGHDTGSAPDSFVPIPGSKRVYLQRCGDKADSQDVPMRFSVMEIDKLSEKQLIAIKSLDDIGKSVGKAAATVPYLKFISWILKFAHFLGRSALMKVAEPEHVLSKDMVFKLADPAECDARASENMSNRTSSTTRREKYGNYLRYGYYFFLNTIVDAKLYAQTGASSQNVPLLLRRSEYNAKSASKNEREYFPLGGVSYVVVKVTRGHSCLDLEQRMQMRQCHRTRLVKFLKKYTEKLENDVE